MTIYNLIDKIYNFARTNKAVNSFTVGIPSKVEGTGEKPYPNVTVELPIKRDIDYTDYRSTFTVDICFLTWDPKESELANLDKSETIADEFVRWLREDDSYDIDSISFMTLTHFSDDDVTGIRLSCNIEVDGLIDGLCDSDEHFDPERTIPDFDPAHPSYTVDVTLPSY